MKGTNGEIKTIRIMAVLLYCKWYYVLIYNVIVILAIGNIIHVAVINE